MITKKIFLASSSELKEDREQFEISISRKNKDWVEKGIFLELIVWEDFLDAVAKTRLQDEYNQAIRESDIFVMLFCTKVGQYTEEEFEIAFGQFKTTNKPFIFTYFKDVEISTGSANKRDLMSLWAFQKKLKALGHFCTVYKNIDALKLKFNQQLDKLAANGFIELEQDKGEGEVEKVREAYSEWAELFLKATIIGTKLAEEKARRSQMESELFSRFQKLHEKAEVVTFKILMLEKRPLVIEAFKKLNSERYPNDPLPDQNKASDFWKIAESDRDIIGNFHGLVKIRLRAFAEWLSGPITDPFSVPGNESYLDFLNSHEKFVKAGLHF